MPSAIFFDLDDTLLWDKKSIETALEKTVKDAEELYGTNPEKLLTAVKETAPQLYQEYAFYDFTKMIGINPFEGLWGQFGDPVHHKFREMGAEIKDYQLRVWQEALKAQGIEQSGEALREKFISHRKSSPFLYEETLDVLDKLKEKYQLVVVTNGAPSLQLEKLRITPELIPYFDHIVISGNVAEGKPGQPIFEHALRVSGKAAEDVWMIGDNLKTDILGANRAGIHSIWIQHDASKTPGEGDGRPDRTISRLKEILNLL
ncbi:HAD family hydrolase [Jeotgalibacillus haloalkalitolerans]|uniref:Phosphoserine phosphatase n=1 Tax=Jeotgalibacillus haloalkalitolerans TaxID=3104292 RepID=A0ABU5KPN3_9BACL|nr:HAD family hydrolase [Jeotgalibacillus sp. HH7-29]MDZ5713214.1 HAD family hydrolase [Jeotgalibacillus sp. HH7-29]